VSVSGGQTTTKTFKDEAARAAANGRIAEKTADGYTEVAVP
jgi:predicted DNA-binding WGR domain protein